MTDAINIKINLARHYLRVNDHRKALALLKEAEMLAKETPDYPYWGDLAEMLESTEQALQHAPPADQELSDGGEEWAAH